MDRQLEEAFRDTELWNETDEQSKYIDLDEIWWEDE